MTVRKSLQRKYLVYSVVLVSAAMLVSGVLDLYLAFEENRPLSPPLQRTALLLVAGVALAFGASRYIARRLVAPIAVIHAGARQLANGELADPIVVESGDELQALADDLNRVAARVNADYLGLDDKADDRNKDLIETQEQHIATSAILRIISSSPTDPKPVFDALLENATRLCDAEVGALGLYDGETYQHVHQRGVGAEQASWLFRDAFRPPPQSGLGRMIADAQPIQIVDGSESTIFGAGMQEAVTGEGTGRTRLWVPLLKEGRVIGALSLYRFKPGAFTQKQIELVSTFANQAAIAIENARLFTELQQRNQELTESLEQQTATSEVLKLISRTTFDLKTVLETLVENAVLLCGATQGVLFRLEKNLYQLEVAYNTPPGYVAWRRDNPIRAGRESITGRAVLERRAIQVDDVLSDMEYRGPTSQPRGAQRTILAVPLIRDEVPIGAIAIFRDVVQPFTEKQVQLVTTFADQAAIAIENVRLFNEIQTKSRELEIANRHKLDFLSSMSHELRTPLNAIIGFSEVLQERMFGEINEKQAEYLNDIHGSGMHLLSLINDILDLSKIDAGRMDLELSRFDLVAALNSALSLMRERASRNGIMVELDCDPGLGHWTADERKFRQIMLNLLSNAVKFTPAKGKISVRARRSDGCVVIAVTDTGIGIEPADQEVVFEEFRQVGSDYLKKSEGTGLGLALTKKFVELHNGRIGLQSKVGKGSTFTFTLPDLSDSERTIAFPRVKRREVDDAVTAILVPSVSGPDRTHVEEAAVTTVQGTPNRSPEFDLKRSAPVPALEKLLASYMGPMAKILVSNAIKRAHTEEELINALADVIDSDQDRSAFLSKAANVMAGHRRS